jgi:SSS family solute:Na+ symporter
MTVVFGVAGMIAGIGMIGVKSILDVWWQLSGIFAAGMLGLFLLGMISRKTGNHEAIFATVIGVLVILWLTFPTLIPENYAAAQHAKHQYDYSSRYPNHIFSRSDIN